MPIRMHRSRPSATPSNQPVPRVMLLLCAALLLSSSHSVVASELAQFVEEGRALWDVPGIAVARINGEDVEFITGGTTELDGDEDITPDTTFAIASTTKAMVAAAAAILVDQGKLNWQDPVTRHFPRLRFGDDYITSNLQVIDLFTHASGIASTDSWDFTLDLPIETQIELFAEVQPTAPYRKRFQYQNTMYALAGELIARVSGQPWDTFVAENLWQPLGMNTTYSNLAAAKADGAAHVTPHNRVEGAVTQIPYFPLPEDQVNAAGSVWSSVSDMSRWARFLLRGGVTSHGERLISEEQFALLFEPQVLIAAGDFYPTSQLTKPKWRSYGLGWFQQDYAGRRIDFHTGSLDGLCAIVGLDRDAGEAVVVLENLDHAEVRHAIMWESFDPDRDWNTEVKALYDGFAADSEARREAFVAARVSDAGPTHALEAYTGTYSHPVWGEINLQLVEGELAAKLPNYDITLDHWHYDTFLVRIVPWWTPQPGRFELGIDGQPTAFVYWDERWTRVAEQPTSE